MYVRWFCVLYALAIDDDDGHHEDIVEGGGGTCVLYAIVA